MNGARTVPRYLRLWGRRVEYCQVQIRGVSGRLRLFLPGVFAIETDLNSRAAMDATPGAHSTEQEVTGAVTGATGVTAAGPHAGAGLQAIAEPVRQRERIAAIDALRGFALLGILVMNISSFALHEGFDFHPTSIGNIGRLNMILWAARFVLFEGKMRGIFSMLFGAGVILLTSRLEQRGEGSRSADIFLRRNMWLVAIGLTHGYFLWFGDILYAYGLTALLFLYPCRKLQARTLIAAGLLIFAVNGIYLGVRYEQRKHLIERAKIAAAAEAAGQKLTDEQKEDLQAWQKSLKAAHPEQSELDEEKTEMRSGYWSVMKRYEAITTEINSTVYYRFGFCDYAGMMLLGMGLLQAGFLSAQLPHRTYAWTAAIGYGIGLPFGAWNTFEAWRHGFDTLSLFKWLLLPYDWQRLLVGLAHASIVLMIVKAGALKWITKPLAAVGQMALSNYLGTSLLCTLIFNGYGFGLFGKLQFYQLSYVVAAVWVVNLVASPLWLKYFRFGPVEWLWRSLTYWKRQPMRRQAEAGAAATA